MSINVRVLQFSTHNEDCGIAKYQEQFVDFFSNINEVHAEFFEYSPNQIKGLDSQGQNKVFNILKTKLKDFDVLHIQHELSFFKNNELEKIIGIAKSLGKKDLTGPGIDALSFSAPAIPM